MNATLALAGLAMGVAASPHCALMCGAPCAALTCHRRADGVGFHVGRVAGYAAGGAVAAASVTALGAWARTVPAVQPLWLLMHLAFLVLGLWWLVAGQMPARLLRDGSAPVRIVRRGLRSWRAGIAGLAWVAWPCAVLQGALLLAALADGAAGGALVMACFALASTPALAGAPWLWQRWQAARGRAAAAGAMASWGYRIAGAGLAISSAWALAHGASEHLAALCRT